VKTLLTAAWVATMDGATFRDGGVVHEGGKIVAVGAGKALKQAHPDAMVEELSDVVLLPGLVNAHTHLELSDLTPRQLRSTSFVDWLIDVMRSAPQAQDDERIHRATDIGIMNSLRNGVTCVGDVTRYPHTTRRLLKGSRIRALSYGEVTGMAARRDFAKDRLTRAVEYNNVPDKLHLGVSPHAPYSIEEGGYRLSVKEAKDRRIGLTTHLAETPHEAQFLSEHAGPFRDLWNTLGAWDDRVPLFHGGPVRYAAALGMLDYAHTSLAHVNYCDDDELALLARGRAGVVYCPRTHRYFGHPPHRWRDMLAAGINVAVGTDSCASSPDLNLVDDLRLLHEIAPDAPAQTLWSLATRRGAKAVGMDSAIGTITPKKAADFTAFAAGGDDPLMAILENGAQRPSRVWVGGERVV
jgi:aminodeoxyfutalosine deaminase